VLLLFDRTLREVSNIRLKDVTNVSGHGLLAVVGGELQSKRISSFTKRCTVAGCMGLSVALPSCDEVSWLAAF
jgi:hypothetical protein